MNSAFHIFGYICASFIFIAICHYLYVYVIDNTLPPTFTKYYTTPQDYDNVIQTLSQPEAEQDTHIDCVQEYNDEHNQTQKENEHIQAKHELKQYFKNIEI